MKTHAIIPIFIPHMGCRNSCVFCDQNRITSMDNPVSASDTAGIIEAYLKTLKPKNLAAVEVAFYGGSFTGIPIREQTEYLETSYFYKQRGDVDRIRLSTRPDYISDEILSNLKRYGVDTIELGVQSFDDDVLKKSNRGHDSLAVYESSRLIKSYGFGLGLQLMIGLPGDTAEKDMYSARELVKIGPADARIYPTAIIQGTILHSMYLAGEYTPLSLEEAVFTTKEMYKIISAAGVNILRVGLKDSFHPAFRQLVESEIAREELEKQLDGPLHSVKFVCNGKSYPNMVGHGKSNKAYFSQNYPSLNISFEIDNSLADNRYVVIK